MSVNNKPLPFRTKIVNVRLKVTFKTRADDMVLHKFKTIHPSLYKPMEYRDVLVMLYDHPRLPVKRYGQILGVSQNLIQNRLYVLESLGWVVREYDQEINLMISDLSVSGRRVVGNCRKAALAS
jgi:hypothetical protein